MGASSIHSIVMMVVLAVLTGCSEPPGIEFQYWVLEAYQPNNDIVVVIDGESHQLPLAIPYTGPMDQWRTTRLSDSRLESNLGEKAFAIEAAVANRLLGAVTFYMQLPQDKTYPRSSIV